ncbi:MAG TPA: hypothetical protein DCQ04_16400 [Actinobacteria bacterium]|nr:hypothetical protein [Actinomycetota bacterium]
MFTYPFALRLGLLALLTWSLPAVAQTAAMAARVDDAAAVLSRAPALSRRTVTLSDHKMTLVYIDAPRLPAPVAPPRKMKPSAQELAAQAEALEVETRRATKVWGFASLGATVYPGPITELNWQSGERTFRAYSTIDFRVLGCLSEIETDSAVLSWFCIASEGDPEGISLDLRRRLNLKSRTAEYVVDATEEEMAAAPEAFAVLDAIHAYFDDHRRELIAAHQKREAEAEARAAELLAHPPVTPDTTVYFWRVEN